MATSEQVADDPAAGSTTGAVDGLATALATVVGVALALAFYVYRKVTLVFFDAAVSALKLARLDALVTRFPTTFAALGLAGALAAAPFGDRLFSFARPDLTAALGLAAFWLASGVYLLASGPLTMPPMQLDGLRASVAARFPERWFARVLTHPLDAIFVRVTINNTLLIVPVVVAIVVRRTPSPLTFVLYLLALRVVGLIHEAMDHANMHNHVFRPKRGAPPLAAALCKAIDLYQEYVLCTAVGRIPGWYPVQHLAVHHGEDGSLDDNQTTVVRDRTSFLQYCALCTSWLFSKAFGLDIARYLFVRGRTKLLRRLLVHVAGYYLFIAALTWLFGPAVLFLLFARAFVTPDTVITHYSWHGFVDPRHFGNVYLNTVHVVGAMDHGFLGLNAHLHHHLHPACHWSELSPAARLEEDRYRAEGVVVVRANGRDRMLMLRLLFERRFEDLAGEMTAIGDAPREDFARLLEERTRPLWPRRWPAALERFDRALGTAVSRWLF